MTVAENIKRIRNDKGITQKKLADALHVSQNAVFNWENGKREPALEMIEKIAIALGVDVTEILDWLPLEQRKGKNMNKYEAIRHAEKVNATLESINNGDSAASNENALFISENTLARLVKSSRVVVEYLFDSIEDEGEYIEIPLDTHQYIENLTTKQAGKVFKNIYSYFFGGVELEGIEDDAVKESTKKTIMRIKEYAENGK